MSICSFSLHCRRAWPGPVGHLSSAPPARCSLVRPSGHLGLLAPWFVRGQTQLLSLSFALGNFSQMALISSEFSLTCVEIKILRRVRAESCVVLHAIDATLLDGVAMPVPRRSVGASDTLVDFHTGIESACARRKLASEKMR